MEFEYPGKPDMERHQRITSSLLRGAFIPFGNIDYDFLQENYDWYREFFSASFNIDLANSSEVFYCRSGDAGSQVAERLLAALAIVMYEIDKEGRDPVHALKTETFSPNKILGYLDRSVQFPGYASRLNFNSAFVRKLERLGIVRVLDSEGRFLFTGAVDVFLSEYDELMEQMDLSPKEQGDFVISNLK